MLRILLIVSAVVLCRRPALAQLPTPTLPSPFVAVDLNVGESQQVTLPGGDKVTVKLLELNEQTDSLRGAVRKAEVKVEVDGKQASLVSANYRLPVTVGNAEVVSTRL